MDSPILLNGNVVTEEELQEALNEARTDPRKKIVETDGQYKILVKLED